MVGNCWLEEEGEGVEVVFVHLFFLLVHPFDWKWEELSIYPWISVVVAFIYLLD